MNSDTWNKSLLLLLLHPSIHLQPTERREVEAEQDGTRQKLELLVQELAAVMENKGKP